MEDYKSLAAIAALPQWPVRLWSFLKSAKVSKINVFKGKISELIRGGELYGKLLFPS
jgi:hypothetical protein